MQLERNENTFVFFIKSVLYLERFDTLFQIYAMKIKTDGSLKSSEHINEKGDGPMLHVLKPRHCDILDLAMETKSIIILQLST